MRTVREDIYRKVAMKFLQQLKPGLSPDQYEKEMIKAYNQTWDEYEKISI